MDKFTKYALKAEHVPKTGINPDADSFEFLCSFLAPE